MAGVRCPPYSRPWINVSSGRWGAPRLRAAAPLPALLAVRVSPATAGNLLPLGSPPAARPRPNAVTLDPQIVRARFRASYSVARCARIISPLSHCGALLPFPSQRGSGSLRSPSPRHADQTSAPSDQICIDGYRGTFPLAAGAKQSRK